jgi:hemerythrin-like domain-containing protein
MSDRPTVMETLRQEHANMTLLLDLLENQVAIFRQGEAVEFASVGGIVDYFLTYPDLVHHPKEDVLFHRLRKVDPAAAIKVERLPSGHEELGLLARRVARAMADHLLQGTAETRLWFVSLSQDFIYMNRRHMAAEEQLFFPEALRVLSEADWVAVDRKIGGRDDPLFDSI